MIGPGDRVFLRACRNAGQPGTVIRPERDKLVVHWKDMDFWSEHRAESLELAADIIAPIKEQLEGVSR